MIVHHKHSKQSSKLTEVSDCEGTLDSTEVKLKTCQKIKIQQEEKPYLNTYDPGSTTRGAGRGSLHFIKSEERIPANSINKDNNNPSQEVSQAQKPCTLTRQETRNPHSVLTLEKEVPSRQTQCCSPEPPWLEIHCACVDCSPELEMAACYWL